MQRGVHFAFSGSVPMQRGVRFGVFDVPLGGPTWPSEGVPNMYKTNAFLHILKSSRKRVARQKRRQKTKIIIKRLKNQYFE